MTLYPDIRYLFRCRVEGIPDEGAFYSMKVWEDGQPEPEQWDLVYPAAPGDPCNGSMLLITHLSDVSFGNVKVVPLGIENISIDINDTNAVISWQTDQPADSNVAYGLTTDYDNFVIDSNLVTDHSIELPGLTPNTLYRYMITSVDSNGIVSQSSDLMFTTTGPDISGIVSDDFNMPALDPNIWTFVNPVGDCSYDFNGVATSDAWLRIHVPQDVNHDPWTSGNRTGRIMQDANNVNFEIEAKFESDLTLHNQIQGLAIQQDVNNWIRFDFHSRSGGVWLYTSPFNDLTPIAEPLYEEITDVNLNTNGNPIWMKVRRQGNTWTQWYSHNGNDWIEVFRFQHILTVTAVGVMAGNAGFDPAFTCNVDYFFNTASPIVPEDGNFNLPPILDPIGNHNIVVDQIVDVNIHAYDPDGQAVTITAQDVPSFADFNDIGDGNAVLHLEPNTLDIGTYFITVTATDPCGLFDSEITRIIVEPNEPPVQPDIISDDFSSASLNTSVWTFIDPVGDCNYSISGTGTADAWINISLPAGTEHQVYTPVLLAPHLVQSVNDVDFEVEVKFESPLIVGGQEQGIIVKRDSDGFMRFEFFTNGTDTYLYIQTFELPDGAPYEKYEKLTGGTPQYMLLNRTADTWTLSYSYDGSNWTVGHNFDYAIEVAEVGFYGGNYPGSGSPAHTASVDYFFSTASPIIPEDPTPPPPPTISSSAGLNGSILPDGATVIDLGDDLTFTATPNTGYSVDTWFVDGSDIGISNTNYTLTNITADHNVHVDFTVNQYDLTITSTAGGSVTTPGEGTIQYNHGQIPALIASPATGYHFVNWTGNTSTIGEVDMEITMITILGNYTIQANFASDEYTVTANAVANGWLDPNGAVLVSYGENLQLDAVPFAGYEVNTWILDGNDLGISDASYTLTNIQQDHTISLTFRPQLTVTATAVANGWLDPNGAVLVSYGENLQLDAISFAGYEVDTWILDGNDLVISDTSYTLTNIQQNHTVSVTFRPQLTVTATADTNGWLDPNGAVLVSYGENLQLDAVSFAGYKVDTWILDGNDLVISDTSYTLTNVIEDHSIAVMFKQIMLTISGRIMEPDGNIPVEDVLILTGSDANAVTDVNGYYELTVNYDWSGTIEPNKTGWIFEPNSDDFNNVTININDVNYTAAMITFGISGYITEANLVTSINDVNVSAANGGGYFTEKYGGSSEMTDVNGFYQIVVDYNFSGTVTPSKYAYSFDPNNAREYTNVLTDYNDQYYVGTFLTYSISGYIFDPNNRPMKNISVDANNGGISDTTDVNGFYEIWIDYNWSGTVTPEKQGYYFDPNEEEYTNVLDDYTDMGFMGIRNEDIYIDGFIDELDMRYIAEYWLQENPPYGDLLEDNFMDFLDFVRLAEVWLIEEY